MSSPISIVTNQSLWVFKEDYIFRWLLTPHIKATTLSTNSDLHTLQWWSVHQVWDSSLWEWMFGRCRKVGCSSYENKESCSWCGASRYIEKHGEACINIYRQRRLRRQKVELSHGDDSQIPWPWTSRHSKYGNLARTYHKQKRGEEKCRFNHADEKSDSWHQTSRHTHKYGKYCIDIPQAETVEEAEKLESGHGDEQSDSGAEHPDTLTSMGNLALTYHKQKRGRSRKAGGSSHGDEDVLNIHTHLQVLEILQDILQAETVGGGREVAGSSHGDEQLDSLLNIHTHSQAWDILHQHTTSKTVGERQRSWSSNHGDE